LIGGGELNFLGGQESGISNDELSLERSFFVAQFFGSQTS